jgi:hypothetical protein
MNWVSISVIKGGREGGDLRGSVVLLLILNGKNDFCILCVLFIFPSFELVPQDLSFCLH